jgi:hypothetical protein
MIGSESNSLMGKSGPAGSNLRIAGSSRRGSRKILDDLGKARVAG